jgi:hypothetical protein
VGRVTRAAAAPADPWSDDAPAIAGRREFEQVGDGERYVLTLQDVPIEFEAAHLRRVRDDLHAQVTVRCALSGARVYQDTLTVSTENLSSASHRFRFARVLEHQSRAPQIDWTRLFDEFAIRVLTAEAAGRPSVLLSEIPDRVDDGYHDIFGVKLVTHGISGFYAKGDSGKSVFALFVLGELAKRGIPVAMLDYEWEGLPHKKRAAQLWPDGQQPPIRYIQCTRPLREEAESIRRDFLHHGIRYFAIDSVVPACHDSPNLPDTVIAFNRAARYVAGTQAGQLWVGHVVKNKEIADGDETFFGSVFWGNLIRAGWFIKAQPSIEGGPLICAYHHRKRNGLPQQPSVGIAIHFEIGRIRITRCDLADSAPDLAAGLPLWQRMRDSLRYGAKTIADLAEELDAKPEAIKKAAQRGTRMFTKLEGGLGIPPRLALVDRRSS